MRLGRRTKISDLIEEAVEIIEKGGVVIFPTETLYGIGCLPFYDESVKRLSKLKRRSRNPFPLVVGSMNTVHRYFQMDEVSSKLAERYWPGPLTLLLKPLTPIHPLVEQDGKVGVRIPSNCLLLVILKRLKKPLIATSANLSGALPPIEIGEISNELLEKVDMVIEGGITSKNRLPSTVYDPEKGKVLREGVIPGEKLDFV